VNIRSACLASRTAYGKESVRHGRRKRKNRGVEGKVGMDERGARTFCRGDSAREGATSREACPSFIGPRNAECNSSEPTRDLEGAPVSGPYLSFPPG